MKGDFTRVPQADEKLLAHFKQQGRPELDADANALTSSDLHRVEAGLSAVIGQAGFPRDGSGFEVSVRETGGRSRVAIAPGVAFVGGRRIVLQEELLLDLPETNAAAAQLVYLDSWARHLVADQEPSLLDPALEGIDTVTALRTEFAVRFSSLSGEAGCEAARLPQPPARSARARLSTAPITLAAVDDPCLIGDAEDDFARGNRLHRVEVHDRGWSLPSTDDMVVAGEGGWQEATLDGSDLVLPSPPGAAWTAGVPVAVAAGRAFFVGLVTMRGGAPRLPLGRVTPSELGTGPTLIRPVGTLKYDAANGAVTVPVSESDGRLWPDRLPRDESEVPDPAAPSELIGGASEERGQLGTASVDPSTQEIVFRPFSDEPRRSLRDRGLLRRWTFWPTINDDATDLTTVDGLHPIGAGGPVLLGNLLLPRERERREVLDRVAVTIDASPSRTEPFHSGDHWAFRTRALDDDDEDRGSLDMLDRAAPTVTEHALSKLAVIRLGARDAWMVEDCRARFPPLNDVQARDVGIIPPLAGMPEAKTVRAALEELAARGQCSVAIQPTDRWVADLRRAVAAAKRRDPEHPVLAVCFAPGRYVIPSTVEVRGLTSLTLSAAPHSASFVAADQERAIWVRGCDVVTVEGLTISAGRVAGTAAGIGGALHIEQARNVTITRCAASSARGRRRTAAAITVRTVSSDVNVSGCHLTVSDGQTGLLITDARRSTVKDNHVQAETPAERTLAVARDLIRANPVEARRLFRTDDVFSAVATATADLVLFDAPRRSEVLDLAEIVGRLLPPNVAVSVASTPVIGGRGISVVGQSSEVVSVTENVVDGFRQGITCALWDGSRAVRRFQRTVRVTDNVVDIRLAETDRARHGIHVGHAAEVKVRDNEIYIAGRMEGGNDFDAVKARGRVARRLAVEDNTIVFDEALSGSIETLTTHARDTPALVQVGGQVSLAR